MGLEQAEIEEGVSIRMSINAGGGCWGGSVVVKVNPPHALFFMAVNVNLLIPHPPCIGSETLTHHPLLHVVMSVKVNTLPTHWGSWKGVTF